MLGKLLDRRYEVTQVLGAGGFGRTYVARDTRRPGHPTCVVKQLKPVSSDPIFLETARRLFNSEAETLEQLGNHDQIPRLLAYFEEDQEFYLVQEFVEGHTLSQELQPGQRWPEHRVIELLQEVLKILDFVHQHGVIHRDVKPDNLIRRNSDNKLVLVDFGAVKQIRTQFAMTEGQARNTVAVGTPGYMSSEQALGQPRPSSDIYTLGIIGIQAITGVMPINFQEDMSTGEIHWQHLAPVSSGLSAVLSRMVRYHFKDRYPSASEALQALQQLNNSYSTPSYSQSPRYSSADGASASRPQVPQPTYSNPRPEPTLAASPGYTPRQPASTPSRRPSTSTSDPMPFIVGTSLVFVVCGVVFGMVYALRQGSFTPDGNNAGNNVDSSQGSCTVVIDALRVRSRPVVNGNNIVDTVRKGATLSLSGTSKNGWVEINSPVKGWVFNDSKFVNCSSSSQIPVETAASPTPVKTPPTPKPSIATPQPVDTGSDALAKAADQYQTGDLDKAIAIAKSIPSGSSAYNDAQQKIKQWQQDWTATKEQFDKLQTALNEGRWDEVIATATDPKFLGQRYWRDQLGKLIEEAKKKKAEAEANQAQPTPSESPPVEQPNSEQTGSEKPPSEPIQQTPPTP
jgi:serine/threonine protein kinase, bacterial